MPGLYGCPVRPCDGPATPPATACPACGGRDARARFRIGEAGAAVEARIIDCTVCGTGRLDPMPLRDVLRGLYPEDYYGAAQPGPGAPGGAHAKFHRAIEWLVRLVAGRHVAFLARDLAVGARVLDVGCGRGVVLNPLVATGFEGFGVELSPAAAHGLDPRVRLAIAERLSDAGYPAGHFDQVILWHVLEHVTDPLETLRECRRLLRPGGRLIVAVPNYSSWQSRLSAHGWFHLDPPRHLSHFTLAGLRRIVARSGFAIRSEHHFSLRQNPFGWIQSAANRFGSRPNALYEYLQGMGPKPSTARRALYWAQLALGAAPAIALSVLAAACRSGATVHVVAEPVAADAAAATETLA